MNHRIGLLAGLVALQLALIAIFWFGGGENAAERSVLLEFGASEVDSLTISDGDSEVLLTRSDAGWEVGDLPADREKVDDLLDKMAALRAPWPVARSAASAERFEVEADNFQRHVVLQAEGTTVGDFYLGTSPGYQRVHVRRADSDEVYSVGLSNYEISVGSDHWLDKGLLALPDAPSRIALAFAAEDEAGQVLERTDSGWRFNGDPADETAATTYANRFVSLQVLGEAETAAEAVALATLQLTHAGGEQTLNISRVGDDGDYFVEDAARAGAFRVATYIAEQLLMTDISFAVEAEVDADTKQDVSGE